MHVCTPYQTRWRPEWPHRMCASRESQRINANKMETYNQWLKHLSAKRTGIICEQPIPLTNRQSLPFEVLELLVEVLELLVEVPELLVEILEVLVEG